MAMGFSKRLLPVILILTLAAILRLWQLNVLPPGLSFDEAADGVQALELMSGQFKLWWPIGGGKEPLMPYTVIPLMAWLGRTPLALRLWGALMGVASVGAIIWLAGVLFPPDENRPWRAIVPLAAGLGLATAFWHVVISRIAFRANCLPLIMSLAIGLLWRGLQTGQRRYFLAGGACTGGLIYTYLPGRLVPVALAIFFILEAIIAWRQQRVALASRFRRELIAFVAAAALVFAPMGIFFLTHPGSFSARAQTVSIFSPAVNGGDLAGALGRTTLTTLGTYFALTGDPNPMTNIPGAPELGWALAALFAVGLILSASRQFSTLNFEPSPLTPELLLLVLWPVMLLPAILAPEGAPHHLRLIGAAPAVYLLIGLGTAQTVLGAVVWLNRIRPVRREWVAIIVLLGIFGLCAVKTTRDYFIVWAKQPELYQAYDVYAVELAAQMAAETDPGAVYVIPMDLRAAAEARHYTLDYLYQGRTPFYYLPVDELAAAQRLNAATAGKSTLKLVRWTKDKHQAADERELVTFLLATGGASLTGAETFPAYTVETYRLPESGFNAKLPAIDGPQAVTLDGRLQVRRSVVLPALTPSRQVAVAVTLAPIAALDADYKASVRLIAPDGAVAAQKDRALLHNWHQPTSLWPAEEVNEYYLLSLPDKWEAGLYRVVMVIYHPDTLAPLTDNGRAEIPLGSVISH